MKFSGLIMTRNEEQFIEECIEHHRDCLDEIIVLDHESEDNTVSIAENLGAKVYVERVDFPDERRNRMQKLAKNNWVAHIDADELFERKLFKSVEFYLKSNDTRIFYLPRFNTPFGTRFPDLQARVLDKRYVEWYRKLHEIAVAIGDTRPYDSVEEQKQYVGGFKLPSILHRVAEREAKDRIQRLQEWREILISNKGQFKDWEFEVRHLEKEIEECRERQSY